MIAGRRIAVAVLAVLLAGCGGASAPTTAPPPPPAPAPATTTAASPTTAFPGTVAEPPPATTATTTTTTTSVPTTTTTVALPDPVGSWERVAVDPATFGGVTLTGAAAAGSRVVVAGCPVAQPPSGPFPVWWSDDGRQWQRAEGPAGEACVVQVEASPFGFFADDRHGRFYRSPDGVTWAPVTEADLGFADGELGVVFAIFVDPAWERVTLLYSRASIGESRVATLVTTTDGVTWEPGPAGSAALFDSTDVNDVIPGGPGLIAVGASPGGEFVPTAAAFTSLDGLTWARATPAGADFDDKVMTSVVAVDDGYVAVGGDFFVTGLMTAWTSPDGVAWERSPHPDEETDPAVAHMTAEAVTVAGEQIWAAGRDFDARRGNQPPRPALWVSGDGGSTWARADLEAARSRVPFELLHTPSLRLGTWPPPLSPEGGPVQLFAQ